MRAVAHSMQGRSHGQITAHALLLATGCPDDLLRRRRRPASSRAGAAMWLGSGSGIKRAHVLSKALTQAGEDGSRQGPDCPGLPTGDPLLHGDTALEAAA